MRAARLTPIVLVLAGGCLAAPPDPLWLQQRQAVTGIPDMTQRALALRRVCESAAQGGDASAVRLMLADLEDDDQHDELARRCAVALAATDKSDARRIARLVADRDLREKAVAEVDAVKESQAP